MISYAQNFEDVILARVFRERNTGFYIDVGAMDPVEGSVTKHFYDLGWRGINIEPDERFYRKLVESRPRDINLNVALGQEAGQRSFYCFEAQGISTLDPGFRDYFASRDYPYREIAIEVKTLAEVCRRHAPLEIDFLKIDAEGWEKHILLGADFKVYRPVVVILEATAPYSHSLIHSDWEHLLKKGNYEFVYFDGLNRYYVRAEGRELRSAFAYPPNVLDDFTLYASAHLQRERDQLARETERLRIENAHLLEQDTALQTQLAESSAALEQASNQTAFVRKDLESERELVERLEHDLAIERELTSKNTAEMKKDLESTRERLTLLEHTLEAETERSSQLRAEFDVGIESGQERITSLERALETGREQYSRLSVETETKLQSLREYVIRLEQTLWDNTTSLVAELEAKLDSGREHMSRLERELEMDREVMRRLAIELEVKLVVQSERASRLEDALQAERQAAASRVSEIEARLEAARERHEADVLWVGRLSQESAQERVRADRLAFELKALGQTGH